MTTTTTREHTRLNTILNHLGTGWGYAELPKWRPDFQAYGIFHGGARVCVALFREGTMRRLHGGPIVHHWPATRVAAAITAHETNPLGWK